MRTRQERVATDTWRSLGCRTIPLEHWSKRKPTVEPRWAKQQTKKLRPKPTKINSFMSGPSKSVSNRWVPKLWFVFINDRVSVEVENTFIQFFQDVIQFHLAWAVTNHATTTLLQVCGSTRDPYLPSTHERIVLRILQRQTILKSWFSALSYFYQHDS